MRKRDILFGSVLISVAVGILMIGDDPRRDVKKYDCSISEISPDYPVEVKEACRKMRAERKKHD
jgi:hypothetical protein